MNDDDSDESIGKKSPILVGVDFEEKPVAVPRPSFITNREYVPSLLIFAMFVFFLYGVQWLASKSSTLGFVAGVAVFAFMAEWERRARYQFGRVRQRAHFDPLGMVKLPVPKAPRPDIEPEPPTPYLTQYGIARTDPALILERARATISGGSEASAMQLALISLLRRAAAIKEAETKAGDQSAGSEKPPKSDDKGPDQSNEPPTPT